MQADLSADVKSLQEKAAQVARSFKAPANYQPNMPQNNMYLPNGELNPMFKAFQDAAQVLDKKVSVKYICFKHFVPCLPSTAKCYRGLGNLRRLKLADTSDCPRSKHILLV